MEIKIVSLHVDYGYITKAHIAEVVSFLGTNKLGWFQEDHYNTYSINFFDVNKYKLEEIKELYASYEQFGDEKLTDWINEYIGMRGWGEIMVFDMDKEGIDRVIGHDIIPENLPQNTLTVHYLTTQHVNGIALEDVITRYLRVKEVDIEDEEWIESIKDKLPLKLQSVHNNFRTKKSGIVLIKVDGSVEETK